MIENNSRLTDVVDLNGLRSLTSLTISSNNKMGLPQFSRLNKLRYLEIVGCENLDILPALDGLINLQRMTIEGNSNLKRITSMQNLNNLSYLWVRGNPNLIMFPDISKMLIDTLATGDHEYELLRKTKFNPGNVKIWHVPMDALTEIPKNERSTFVIKDL